MKNPHAEARAIRQTAMLFVGSVIALFYIAISLGGQDISE